MTLAEFKAWFSGFTEEITEAPSAKQWEKIKAKVAEIDGRVTAWPVYTDIGRDDWTRRPYVTWSGVRYTTGSTGESATVSQMYDAGRNEALKS